MSTQQLSAQQVRIRPAVRRLGWLLVVLALGSVAGQAQIQDDKSRAGQVTRPKGKQQESNTRLLEGMVLTVAGAPVDGAIVQLKDVRSLQIRSFRTGADGKYRFAGLSMDTDYELHATQGELNTDTKRISSFDSRKSVTTNLQLEAKK